MKHTLTTLDKIAIKLRRHSYIRTRIAKQLGELVKADPSYQEYREDHRRWRDELLYSGHCGMTRDGSDADREYNKMVDAQVLYYENKVFEHLARFKGYANETHIPLIGNTRSVKHYYLDLSFRLSWVSKKALPMKHPYYIDLTL